MIVIGRLSGKGLGHGAMGIGNAARGAGCGEPCLLRQRRGTGRGVVVAACGPAGLWCSLGALWFEALGMWSVVFSWGVWCVSLGDRRVGLAALGLRVWC